MRTIAEALDAFFALKAYAMLPLLVLAGGLAARMGLKAALASALRVGAGFAGVFAAFAYFVGRVAPAVAAIAASRGISLPVLDAGWPPLAAATWAWEFTPLVILLVAALNGAMLALRLTRMMYVDLWNYWHFAMTGALLAALGARPVLALAASLAIAAYTIKVSEWSAPYVERRTGITGIGLSPLTVAGFLPWAVAANRLIERLPVLRSLRYDPGRGIVGSGDSGAAPRAASGAPDAPDAREAGGAGLLGEPATVGFIVGLLLSILAGYRPGKALETAIEIAAAMFIVPRCGALVGEGMGAFSRALGERIAARFPGGRGLLIAMDTGVVMGDRSVSATGLVLIPVALGLAFVLPGNRILPVGDLPNLVSIMSCVAMVAGGNVIRAALIGTPILVGFFYVAGATAPLVTRLARETGMDYGAGAALFNSFTDGGNPVRFLFVELFRGDLVALAVLPLFLGLTWYAGRRHRVEGAASSSAAAAGSAAPAAPPRGESGT